MKCDKAQLRDCLGTIESVVPSRRIDQAVQSFRSLSDQAHGIDLERRRSLRTIASAVAAAVAGGGISTALLSGEAQARQAKSWSAFNKLINPTWAQYLLTQDPVRGPSLLLHPRTKAPMDFKQHLADFPNLYGAVDYAVPEGTPVVPISVFRRQSGYQHHIDGLSLVYLHPDTDHPSGPLEWMDSSTYGSRFNHLKAYSPINIITGKKGWRLKDIRAKVLALSGHSGRPPYRNGQSLDNLMLMVRKGSKGQGKPGFDPFVMGLDRDDIGKRPMAGRPIYWDGRTQIFFGDYRGPRYDPDSVIDKIRERAKHSDDIDKETRAGILSQPNIMALRDYLAIQVLEKHPDENERPVYRHLPGSRMYSFMLSALSVTAQNGRYTREGRHFDITGHFTVMLPFISPHVTSAYEEVTPGLDLLGRKPVSGGSQVSSQSQGGKRAEDTWERERDR